MGAAIFLLVLAILFFGLGFAVKALFYVAIALLAVAAFSALTGRNRG